MSFGIRFDEVSIAYDHLPVLQDFSMMVQPGEAKIILGGSGSGKSTILKLVLGLVRPDSGRVLINDQDITRLSEDQLMPFRQQIGMVFQEGALFDSLTVGENVGYRLYETGDKSDEEIEGTVSEVLGFVGLAEAINKMPAELSGGMRRRVAIARALVGEPKILLYDEPTAGLDPITSRTICELIIELRDLKHVTSIFVTHDLKAARTVAGEIAVYKPNGEIGFEGENGRFCLTNTKFVILKGGRVIFEGVDEELNQSQDKYIQEFLSYS